MHLYILNVVASCRLIVWRCLPWFDPVRVFLVGPSVSGPSYIQFINISLSRERDRLVRPGSMQLVLGRGQVLIYLNVDGHEV